MKNTNHNREQAGAAGAAHYLVRANYVPARADISPPCWWFRNQDKAEAFARSLTSGKPAHGVAMAYSNVTITKREA